MKAAGLGVFLRIEYMNEDNTAWMGGHPFEDFRNRRRKQTVLALSCALLVHLLLWLTLPDRVIAFRSSTDADEASLEIELVPDETLPEELRFVEANPDVPENEPDQTKQYSFRSQQAADEQAASLPDNTPAVDGEEASQKIVQGAVEEAQPLPPGVYSPEARPGEGEGTDGGKPGAEVAMLAPRPQALQPPDFLQQEPETEEGPGSRLSDPGKAKEDSPEPDPEAPLEITRTPPSSKYVQAGDGNGGSPEARPIPKARPRLSPDLLQGPLMRSTGAALQRGTIAIDATFSEFGEYQQQFLAAIQAGWYQEIEFYQPIDTAARVHLRFELRSDGSINGVEIVETTAGEVASVICQSAIEKRSPFRPWTREMVAVFGDRQTMDVVFHYH